MARKDVDLVIRAKDEAAKVVDAITEAIHEFVSAQSDLNKSSTKTASTLGALGAAFGGLDKELRGMSIGDKLTKELNTASDAVDRLKAEFAETAQEANRLSGELKRAEFQTDTLKAKTAGAAAAQAKAATALEKQKNAQKELTAALAEATKERDQLVNKEARLTTKIGEQEVRVAKTTERYEQLTAQIAAATGPTKTLEGRLASTSTTLANQTTKLEQLRGTYAETVAGIERTGEAIATITGSLTQVNTAVARQETILGKIAGNYKELATAAKTAARSQSDITEAVDRNSGVLERQSGRIQRAEDELIQLSVAAGKADAAFAELAAQSNAAMQQAFGNVRSELAKARAEFKQTSGDAKALAEAMDIMGPPTRQQVVELGRLAAASDAAEKAIIEQFTALREMRAVLEQDGSSLEALRAKQERFVAIQREMASALDRIQQEGKEAAAVYDRLATATERTAQGQRQTGQAVRSTGSATEDASRKTNALADAYRRLYGESRQALSLTQRLRGEVLSLISAYGGVFAVISVLQQTVSAYQQLEAAQNRLNVAFDGNQGKVGQELDFIRRNANRLGIEFGTLATEYSKFAIATQGTSLEGDKTRKIFISVAEAARVAKISNEQLQGVFTALTQIVSKGAVQMEELRQQLGDRLPGAIQLMADGLGVGTDELIKMMEQGQVTAEALVPFAEELDKRFGPGLAKALESTTTAMGDFKNASLQALLAFGNAGFIEGFTDLLRDLSATLRSADFQAFTARVSQAFKVLLDAIGLAVENFDLLVVAAAAFAGVKLTPAILSAGNALVTLYGRFQRVGTIMAATRNTMIATTATTTGLATAAGVASTALRGMALAVRALFSATGIGLAVTAISVGLALWATRADEATDALVRHRDIVDQAKNAYDKAGGAAKNWAEALKGISVTQATQNVAEMIKLMKAIRAEAKTVIAVDTNGAVKNLNELIRGFKSGDIEAASFKRQLDELSRANPNLNKTIIAGLQDLADRAIAAGENTQQARDVLIALTGTAEQAEAAMKRLAGVTDESANSSKNAAGGTKEYWEALKKIDEIVPEISKKLDTLKDKANLDEAFQSAARAAKTISELQGAVDAYGQALDRINNKNVDQLLSGQGDGAKIVDIITGIESGGNSKAKNPNSSATGLGQFIESTWLRMFKQYFPDRAAGLSDAMILELRKNATISREMVALYIKENAAILNQAGVAVNKASVYLAHFLGPKGAIAVLTASANTPIENILSKKTINSNESILRGQTAGEVAAWAAKKVGISEQELAVNKELFDLDAKRAQEAEKAHEKTVEQIADNESEIKQQQLKNAGKEREAEIEKAIAEARKKDPGITDTEIAKIREQTGALFDLQQVKKLDKAQSKEAEAQMQRINALLQQRTTLEQALKLARQQGDTAKVDSTTQQIQAVNAQLQEAIAKAREMWEAIGGTAADTALIKLDTAALKAGNLAAKAQQNYIDWTRVGDLFASGLTNAFDNFAKAVAEGEDVGEAARKAFLQFASDFLREIAQMIIKQAILNAMRSFGFPGLTGGVGVGVAHKGGRVGSSRAGSGNGSRKVNPAIFANAMRAHSGGVPGLSPGEVPLVVKENEEILTREDPRHVLNGGLAAAAAGAAGSSPVSVRNVNVFNAEDMLERALRTRVGEKIVLNFIRDNPNAVQAALEGQGS